MAKTFEEVVAALEQCQTIPLKRGAFLALPKKQRNEAKQVPFFTPAAFRESPSKRDYEHASLCNLIFLDIDELPDGTCPAAPFADNPALLHSALAGLNFIAYFTVSSTREKPRMRVVVDADQIPLAEYPRAVATIGSLLGLPSVTKESSVAVQPMFLPTLFADSPKGYSPVVAKCTSGRKYTRSDIRNDSQGALSTSGNGANGEHEPADDLEHLVSPDPDITLAVARELLDALDADLPRSEWINCAAALKHQFAPKQEAEAFALFDEWSKEGDLYGGEKHTRTQWKSLRQTPKGRSPITIRTLVKMATKAGWVDKRKPKASPQVDAYYDSEKKEYLLRNERGKWLSHGDVAFKRHLRKVGFSTRVPEGVPLSPAEQVMDRIMNHRDVDYAGPLAGRASGFYEESGVRFLVTASPRIVEPTRGECKIIMDLLRSLVGQGEYGATQLATVLGWLKTGYEALRARKRQPGQALALAGPVDCGKSLFQSIITEVLGGRCAKPWRYMAGRTEFNKELFGAEHLMLEDEQSTTDNRSRSNLGAHIKAIAVNEWHSCHAKGRDAVGLRPFWWLSISLNDEPEAMLVMPSMRVDLADKVILIQCSRPTKPFPTGTHDLRCAYWQSILAEIPAFVQFLLDYEIPCELRDTRFGVRYFHHPELLESLRSLAPETKLLELIDRTLFSSIGRKTAWEGTAGELESLLRGHGSDVREEAIKLFQWGTACGVYLGKLENKGRVRHKRNREKRLWVIQPPTENDLDLDNY